MSLRKNKQDKPTDSYKKRETGKSSGPYRKTASGNDFNKGPAGRNPSFKKRSGDQGDPNELAPPRFLAPRGPKNPYARKGPEKDSRGERPAGKRPYRPREEGSAPGGRGPSFKRGGDDSRPFRGREENRDSGRGPSFKRGGDDSRPFRGREENRDSGRGPSFKRGGDDSRPYRGREDNNDGGSRGPGNRFSGDERKPYGKDRREGGFKKPGFKTGSGEPEDNFRDKKGDQPYRPKYDPQVKVAKVRKSYTDRKNELLGVQDDPDDIRLNKYIANAGVCSRREADELIKQGLVSVNGEVMTEMGYKVKKGDVVRFDGRKILPEPFVYILMNKPKDFITTTDDEKGRKTVMDLLADKIPQRVYPIGRLDRNTTGVLLLTNDGEVAQAMTHPSFQIKKVYHAVLDKKVSGTDLDKLVEGVELEDGVVHADAVAFVDNEDRRHVGVEIHSGRNRVVRRMFEHLGYDVEKLDRVSMGIFTKKDLPRGKWRFLKESEIGYIMKLKANMP